MLKKQNHLIFLLFIFTVLIGSALSYTNLINKSEDNETYQQSSKQTDESNDINEPIPTSDANMYSSIQYEQLDELIRSSDVIVLGEVVNIEPIGNQTDENKFLVTKQYKGHIESSTINVYEFTGTLSQNQSYLLFLSALETPYYPDTTYRSIDKNSIISSGEQNILHHSNVIPNHIELSELEELITSSPHINKTNAPSELFPAISRSQLSLEQLIDKADLVAQVTVSEMTSGNNYISNMKLKFNHVFKYNEITEYDFDFENMSYVLPSSMTLGEEYLVFLFFYDNMFYTVTTEGSIIAKRDAEKWATTLQHIANQYNPLTLKVNDKVGEMIAKEISVNAHMQGQPIVDISFHSDPIQIAGTFENLKANGFDTEVILFIPDEAYHHYFPKHTLFKHDIRLYFMDQRLIEKFEGYPEGFARIEVQNFIERIHYNDDIIENTTVLKVLEIN